MRSSTTARREPRDDHLDRVFHALADRTRRAMLGRLARGPASVGALATPFAMSRPAASKHLKVLEGAGLVTRVVEGRAHRCTLHAAALADAERWLAHYRDFWRDTLAALARHAERRPARRR